MIRFANIEMLWLLAVVPVMVIIYMMYRKWRNNAINKFGAYEVITRIMSSISGSKITAKFILFTMAMASLGFGLADLQFGTKMEEVKRKGIDLVVAIDVSNSMLAEDLAPNRLEHAKRSVSQLIDRLHSDRIGMVVFAGQSYVQLPITTDYAAAKLFLSSINTKMVPTQGTAIGDAIETSVKCFDPESPTQKAIIVITDGENHEDDAKSAAADAARQGITVHTIGLGTSKGAPIPIYKNDIQQGFRKDNAGNTVITKLNEDMLAEIAAMGHGIYVRSTNSTDGLRQVMQELENMEKEEYGTTMFTDYEDRYQVFLGIALLLFIIESLLTTNKSKLLRKLNLYES